MTHGIVGARGDNKPRLNDDRNRRWRFPKANGEKMLKSIVENNFTILMTAASPLFTRRSVTYSSSADKQRPEMLFIKLRLRQRPLISDNDRAFIFARGIVPDSCSP